MSEKPTPEQLAEIEEMASLQFLPKEIAVIVGVPIDAVENEIFKESGEIYTAYFRGQLKAEAEVRKSILQMAKQGSTPAQKQVMDLIAKNKKALEE